MISIFYRVTNISITIEIIGSLSVLSTCGSRPFRLKNIVKADINLVADAHIQEMNKLLKTLMIKLYRHKPIELHKQPNQSIESRLVQIFDQIGELKFIELDDNQGTEAMRLCFDEHYRGDRVFAVMVGLIGMVRQS